MSTSRQNHQGHRHSEQSYADAGNASMSVSSVDISISVADSSSDEEGIGSSNGYRGQGGRANGSKSVGSTPSASASASPSALRASEDIAVLSRGPNTTRCDNSAAGMNMNTIAADPDFEPVNDEVSRPDEKTYLLHASDNNNSRVEQQPPSSLARTEFMTPIRSDDIPGTSDDPSANYNSILLDTNYNFDPNAVGASAPAGPSGSVHGISLHQFFFPRYNPTIQRYYRFTASSETPFAALHKRPGSSSGSGGSVGGTSNNSGVTGLLRRSAGEYTAYLSFFIIAIAIVCVTNLLACTSSRGHMHTSHACIYLSFSFLPVSPYLMKCYDARNT